MTRARPLSVQRRVEAAIERMRRLLPGLGEVSVVERTPTGAMLRVRSPARTEGDALLVARERLEPQDVGGLSATTVPTVVFARWLSPRTRELLRQRGIGYIDATGNVELTLVDAGVFIRSDGAARDPQPRPTKAPTLRGPKAWAALRTLAEVQPPYGVRELASTIGVDPGYISRILRALEDELLIERPRRGPVTSVDWEGVLRKLAATYSLFAGNDTSNWVAPGGPEQFLRDVREKRTGPWAVSGSFGAARLAPIAPPEVAVVYTDDPERLATAGGLLPTTRAANVTLATPYDPIAFERLSHADGIAYVASAQLAVDCLTGSGRMPEEGEAVLTWMRQNTARWQVDRLDARAKADR